jgi:hypothetical protein
MILIIDFYNFIDMENIVSQAEVLDCHVTLRDNDSYGAVIGGSLTLRHFGLPGHARICSLRIRYGLFHRLSTQPIAKYVIIARSENGGLKNK